MILTFPLKVGSWLFTPPRARSAPYATVTGQFPEAWLYVRLTRLSSATSTPKRYCARRPSALYRRKVPRPGLAAGAAALMLPRRLFRRRIAEMLRLSPGLRDGWLAGPGSSWPASSHRSLAALLAASHARGSTSPSVDDPASSSWSETEMTQKPVRLTNGRVTGTLTLPLRVITAAMCCCLLRKSI